jgi:predicted dehydrogenase/CheY-like chemotaxis protein
MTMRLLIVGCGSMGRRRTRNLLALNAGEILAFDNREDRRREIAEKHGVMVFDSFEAALDAGPDVVFVCVPPDQHTRYIEAAIEAGKPVFSEAPMVNTLAEMDEIIALAAEKKVLVAPSCTYLHHVNHQRVRDMLDTGKLAKPVSFLLDTGHHVANWHPWEDYRTFYASDRAQGGMGWDILVHEIHLIEYLVGTIQAVMAMARDRLHIEGCKGFDNYDVVMETDQNVSVMLHCDMFQRPWGLHRRLACDPGVAVWNWDSLRVCTEEPKWPEEPVWEDIPLPEGYTIEDTYVPETAEFLAASRGEADYRHSLQAERHTLEVMLAIEESSAKGTLVRIGPTKAPARRVLIADDQDMVRHALRWCLEAEGFEVLEAQDGLQAIQVATARVPDAILLDIDMPHMGGLEALRKLKEAPQTRDIPVLMLTAQYDAGLEREALEAGAASYVMKPAHPRKLMEQLEAAMPG